MANHKIDGNDGAGNVQAPERIWMFAETLKPYISGGGKIMMGDTEYIRADVAEAELAAMTAARDELASAIDDIETSHGLTDNGNLWRFWAKKAREIADKNTNLSAQLAAAKARADVARDNALVEAAARVRTHSDVARKMLGKATCEEHAQTWSAIVSHIDIDESAILALRDKPAPAVTVEIDLVQVIFAQLCEAANQSNWIPQEHYYANDWISDCCDFLRTGRGAIAPPEA